MADRIIKYKGSPVLLHYKMVGFMFDLTQPQVKFLSYLWVLQQNPMYEIELDCSGKKRIERDFGMALGNMYKIVKDLISKGLLLTTTKKDVYFLKENIQYRGEKRWVIEQDNIDHED